MTRTHSWVACGLALALGLGALGCGNDEELSPCVDGDLGCGRVCGKTGSKPCTAGLYCSAEGLCSKACSVSGDLMCADKSLCSSDGRCMSSETASGGASGGSNGTGGTGTGTGGIGGAPPPGACADTVVRATMVIPTVILIVDQSSSMNEAFGNASRWDTLRDFLLQSPDGLIADLQSQVRFGLAMYSAESGGDAPDPIGECPMVTSVAPALDNFDAIDAVYGPAEPIEDTPTGDAIDKILDDLNLTNSPDTDEGPTVFVLATDGEPDRCEELDPQNGQEEAIAAVTRAFGMGVRTFVISVGSELSAQHQQDIANAGLGRAMGDPDAEYWVAGDDASLRAALTEIVGGQLGCEVQLNGSVASGDACTGTVKLNGKALECDDADGWELSTPRNIRLKGAACDELKKGNFELDVSFPCDVKLVI